MRMRTLVLTPVLAASLVACRTDDPTEPPDTTTAAAAWLKANAIPFTRSSAGGSHADLLPVKTLVGNARIVALGEATHGTREFFEMKHRLLEFLVREDLGA